MIGTFRRPRPVLAWTIAAAVLAGGGAGAAALPASGSPAEPAATSRAAHSVPALARKIDPGVVDVDTNQAYLNVAAAGTGIVLTSKGEVVTNNHVIRDATSIRVTDLGNRRTYRATVVGYDVAADVAVLKLHGASKLAAAPLASHAPKTGTPVLALGNAGGKGGRPSRSTGTITARDRQITASDAEGGSEQLSGMLESSASLQPGDSGGPLVDRSSGKVVGMDTAGSSTFQLQSGGGAAFSIPIGTVRSIARKIETGESSGQIHVGRTAFLGVLVTSSPYLKGSSLQSGAIVQSAVPGGPAAKAGIGAGDVITGAGSTRVSGPTSLTRAVLAADPTGSISLRWITPSGASHHAKVRLVPGPPQ